VRSKFIGRASGGAKADIVILSALVNVLQMPNSLTRNAGLRLGPVVLETLAKHYFDRIKKEDAQRSKFATQLHQDELLYHEAFNIVRVRS